MQDSVTAMRIALRVLTAIADRKAPNNADVEELRKMAPQTGDAPLDDLACDVIQQALKRRADARKSAS